MPKPEPPIPQQLLQEISPFPWQLLQSPPCVIYTVAETLSSLNMTVPVLFRVLNSFVLSLS